MASCIALGSWAQEGSEVIPEPPPAPEIEASDFSPEKRVRIMREDGVLTIKTQGENGERSEVQVDLGGEFGGPLSQKIIERLKDKGILDIDGQVTGETLNSVPDNVRIGLSADRDHASQRWAHRHASHEGDDDSWLIPVVALFCVFGMPVLIVWLVTRSSYRKKQLVMNNINRMVADGRDVPPELIDLLEEREPVNSSDRGITLIAIGAAVFLSLSALAGIGVGSLGLIPLFIGVARYVNWKLDNKQA
ncbi:DUF6249 domain-containing protein [Microbulbifer sp. OS29]|uniref:DUF6249 domain-containing protein n=1 Tax=Microbulbifer okhotskensis TaxID=2926617 RepID=A0A9X2EPF8_9GAMM|nr:DUF6249 domain-containing protein [Microbulbifer okhotskensis]MCO1333338.1 DUF6249 domain-containing protein [Microbulbifer okhotskensis]